MPFDSSTLSYICHFMPSWTEKGQEKYGGWWGKGASLRVKSVRVNSFLSLLFLCWLGNSPRGQYSLYLHFKTSWRVYWRLLFSEKEITALTKVLQKQMFNKQLTNEWKTLRTTYSQEPRRVGLSPDPTRQKSGSYILASQWNQKIPKQILQTRWVPHLGIRIHNFIQIVPTAVGTDTTDDGLGFFHVLSSEKWPNYTQFFWGSIASLQTGISSSS